MAHLDRRRAERLMSEAGLDALILLAPESFSYATGAAPGVATMWRRAGAVAVLVPADPAVAEGAVVSDLFVEGFRAASHITDVRESPTWIETTRVEVMAGHTGPEDAIADAWKRDGRTPAFARPETFDAEATYRHVADMLAERGLSRGRIGFEGAAVAVTDYARLAAALDVDLVDATDCIGLLKAVKSPEEIALLRRAVDLTEHGIGAIHDAIASGVSRSALSAAWTSAIFRHGEPPGDAWDYISVGPDPWGGDATARSGDLVKVDVGCVVDGYTADVGRTFVLGNPSDLQARLHDALAEGYAAGSALLRPGVRFADIHFATQAAIRAAGFPAYARGHFGHSLGPGPGIEQWPFISAGSDVVAEPGMVLAFECPWYLDGLGGMIIESDVLITATGHEPLNTLTTELVRVAG